MIKRLLYNTVVFGITPHISQLAAIVILPLITPFLTKQDYGTYANVMSLMTALSVFSAMGTGLLFANSFIKHPNHYRKRWRFLYGSLTVWMIFFAVLQAIPIYFLMPDEVENKLLVLFLVSGPTLCFGPVSTLGGMYYSLSERSTPVAVRGIIAGNLAVVLNLVFIKYQGMGYMGWLWAQFIVSILLNLSYWPVVNLKLKLTPIFAWKPRMLWNFLKITLPTVPHYYSGYLLETSIFQVMNFSKISQDNIGRYSLANGCSGYGNAFVMALNTAFNPRIMKLYAHENQNLAKNLVLLMQNMVFLATCTAAIWSKEIINFLYRNDDLTDFYPLFIILVMSLNYRPMYIASSNMFFLNDATKRLWKITFLGGIMFVIANLICLPKYGIMASVILYFIVQQYIGYSGFFMREYKKHSKINFNIFQSLALTIGLTTLLYFTIDYDLMYRVGIFISLIVFFGIRGLMNLMYLKNEQ